jgi:hypothetical protein
MSFTFEKLYVYQKSVDFADEVCSKTEQFARGYGHVRKTGGLSTGSPLASSNPVATLTE